MNIFSIFSREPGSSESFIVLRRIGLVILVLIAVACSWMPGLSDRANEQIDSGFKRALVGFAVARSLNAVISVIQETELTVQPLGFGIKFAPGQALDPVNDLVETFADVMLTAAVAFGVQKALLSIVSTQAISLLVTLTAIAWLGLYLTKGAPFILSRLLAILLAVRFAFPLIAFSVEGIHSAFLKPSYAESISKVETAISSVSALQTDLVPAKAPPSITGDANSKEPESKLEAWKKKAEEQIDSMKVKAKGVFSWPSEQIDLIKGRVNDIRQKLENTTEYIARIMAVFVVETVIIPIGLLWLLWRFAGSSMWTRPSGRQNG